VILLHHLWQPKLLCSPFSLKQQRDYALRRHSSSLICLWHMRALIGTCPHRNLPSSELALKEPCLLFAVQLCTHRCLLPAGILHGKLLGCMLRLRQLQFVGLADPQHTCMLSVACLAVARPAGLSIKAVATALLQSLPLCDMTLHR